jgi:hypothetical protein
VALISCSDNTAKHSGTSARLLEETNLQQELGDENLYFELDFNFNKGFLHGETVQVAKALCDDAMIAFSIMKDKDTLSLHCVHNPNRSVEISYKATKQGDGYVLKLDNFKFNNIAKKATVDGQELSMDEVLKSWRWFVNTADKAVEIIATHNPEQLKDVLIDYDKKTITCMRDNIQQTLPLADAAFCSLLIGYIKSSPR